MVPNTHHGYCFVHILKFNMFFLVHRKKTAKGIICLRLTKSLIVEAWSTVCWYSSRPSWSTAKFPQTSLSAVSFNSCYNYSKIDNKKMWETLYINKGSMEMLTQKYQWHIALNFLPSCLQVRQIFTNLFNRAKNSLFTSFRFCRFSGCISVEQ